MYKILNGDKIVGVVENWSETDKKHHLDLKVEEDRKRSVSDYIDIDKEYVLTTDSRAIEFKKNSVRKIRNFYLEKYVDPVVSNPLRWSDMPEEEQKEYSDYRRYLLGYPESSEAWYEENPKTFEEWLNV